MAVTAAFIVPHPPLIVPRVGKGQEKKTAKTARSFHAVSRKIAALKPER